MRKSEMQEGGQSRDEAKTSEVPLTVEPSEDETTLLSGDELEIIGDLGSEFDDPEGAMSERPDYWMQQPAPPLPTRAAFMRHRINELFDIARSWKSGSEPAWPATAFSDAQWRGLADSVFDLGGLAEVADGSSSKEKQPEGTHTQLGGGGLRDTRRRRREDSPSG